jgi:hypothetical protein
MATYKHLENLVTQGMMTAIELTGASFPSDPVVPTLPEGYVVSFEGFHERGLDVPSQ